MHTEEWRSITGYENRKHAYNNGLAPQRGKPRKVIVKHDEKIVVFETLRECSAFFGFKNSWLNTQIRKQGTTFIYKDYLINVVGKGMSG